MTLASAPMATGLDLVIRGATVVTAPPGHAPLRGIGMSELQVLAEHDVGLAGGRIVHLAPAGSVPAGRDEVDARGRLLLPGFVDCHTHALWAGSRVDEWVARARGASYAEIREAGGGIQSTVGAVRAAADAELLALLRERLSLLRLLGTLTVEVKSGYGLRGDEELRLLRIIREASAHAPAHVVPTALLGHAIEPTVADFTRRIIDEALPRVSAEFPGIAVDAYVDEGAWSPDDGVALLREARRRGHPVRVHADQFRSLGMVEAAIALGAVSVDHLEASSATTLGHLARSATIGVLLPLSGFHVDGRFADGRALIDAGGAVAVATNWNPGTGPSADMRLALHLAVRHCGLTPAEALCAATANAAAVLGLRTVGRIAPGFVSRLVLWETDDWRELVHDISGMIRGRVIGC